MYSKALGSLSTRHCHLCLRIWEILGRRLSKGTERTILLLGDLGTFSKVASRGILFTLAKAASITAGLYFLETSSDFRIERFARKFVSRLSIRLSLYAREYGMFLVMFEGWEEEGSKYCTTLLGLVKRVVWMKPSWSTQMVVSKKSTALVSKL